MKYDNVDLTNIEACAELCCDAFSKAPWSEQWEYPQALDRLNGIFSTPDFIGLCVLERGEVVGFCMGNIEPFMEKKLYLLREMCISGKYQGKGIGTTLLQNLERKLSSEGVSGINLLTKPDTITEKFYLNNGYNVSASYRFYYKKLCT